MMRATSNKLLTLKYVPLAWVAVLLTSLSTKLLTYYSGSPLNVESYEVLAYIPGVEEIIEDEIIWSGKTKHVSISFERDKSIK